MELGKPLRGSRLFPTKALARNIALLHDIETFAAESNTLNWQYWSIKIAGRKATVEGLKEDLCRFNSDINSVFTELRKKHDFKLIVLAIHVRYDQNVDAFDLHAHFVCDIPSDQRKLARARLSQRFSLVVLLPDEPIRNLAAAVTYELWNVYDREEILTWPESAIRAVWTLHSGQSKPQLVRTGKTFQLWRKARSTDKGTDGAQRVPRRADHDETNPHCCYDRILTKTTIRIGGRRSRRSSSSARFMASMALPPTSLQRLWTQLSRRMRPKARCRAIRTMVSLVAISRLRPPAISKRLQTRSRLTGPEPTTRTLRWTTRRFPTQARGADAAKTRKPCRASPG